LVTGTARNPAFGDRGGGSFRLLFLLGGIWKKGVWTLVSLTRTSGHEGDLDPEIYRRTRAVCAAVGVKGKALLDA